MKKLIMSSLLGLLLVPAGAFAGCGAPVCASPCVQTESCIPRVENCYRTVNNPCLQPDLGVGRLLGHIFAPRCMPQCQPCSVCR